MQLGKILYLGDSVLRIGGIANLRRSEMVYFKQPFSNFTGQVFDLDSDGTYRIALLDGRQKFLKVGDPVYRSFHQPSIRTGFGVLGQVITPTGQIINKDDLNRHLFILHKLFTFQTQQIEAKAPGIMERYPVRTTVYTGINAMDVFLPIGAGQRELIVGDKGTGKTTLSATIVLHQRFINLDVHLRWRLVEKHFSTYKSTNFLPCIFCSIGQRRSEISKLYFAFTQTRAMEYTSIVFTAADENPALQYIAPYSATTMAEAFRDLGYHPIVIYDDLSNHAVAYRQISLLLRRPPGREAYPGDIFFLHSRLLERSGQLNKARGGGSVTSFPLIETKGNDMTAYIPTNVVSITDGQVYTSLDAQLKGLMPFIEVSESVSRIGAVAQNVVVNKYFSKMKRDFSLFQAYEDLEGMSGMTDPYILDILRRGKRIYRFMTQEMYESMRLYLQVLFLQSLSLDLLDKVKEFLVLVYFRFMFSYVDASHYLKGSDVSLYAYIAFPDQFDALLMYLPEGAPKRFFDRSSRVLTLFSAHFLKSVQPQIPDSMRYTILQAMKAGSYEYF